LPLAGQVASTLPQMPFQAREQQEQQAIKPKHFTWPCLLHSGTPCS